MKIATIGECMIELRGQQLGSVSVGYGGDTLNTAVYMARLGCQTAYVTQVGDDPLSEEIVEAWTSEGIDTSFSIVCEDRQSGMYLISTTPDGERSFRYWRSESPARELWDQPSSELIAFLSQQDLLYLSGISLSLYGDRGRKNLLEFACDYRAQGGVIAFDLNYRPKNWTNETTAQQAITDFLKVSDLVLPSLDDHSLLFGDGSVDQAIDFYLEQGVELVVLKDGPNGATVAHRSAPSQRQHYLAEQNIKQVDTTAAGDTFNAGFLAAYANKHSIAQAVRVGSRCAALVIQHPGAIIDADIFTAHKEALLQMEAAA